jgi:uncharacterized protein (DUF2126 family)
VDEARHGSLHELDIAFSHLPSRETPAYRAGDRSLRHLLVGTSGNTHRAEFCIDKLYSPDSGGPSRLLELRLRDASHART